MNVTRTLAFGLLLSCGSDVGTGTEVLGRVRQPILGGTASDATQDATVMLVQIDPATSTRVGVCTAALVAPRLILTARHCVARTNGANVACEADGTPLIGGEITGNEDPAGFFVFTGSERPANIGDTTGKIDTTQWKPASQGAEIIDDRSGTLCNHDLALILLKDPIVNVPLATLRLDREAKIGESLRTIGWGVASAEVEPQRRQQRSGVTVERSGPDEASPVLTKSEFLFGESICLGDSGGPVFSAMSNAIVGVVSRGGNGADPSSGGPASTCVDADNVATKLSPFRELVLEAFARAGAEPIVEPPPDEDDGCNTSGRRGPPTTVALILGLAGLVRRWRRRRVR